MIVPINSLFLTTRGYRYLPTLPDGAPILRYDGETLDSSPLDASYKVLRWRHASEFVRVHLEHRLRNGGASRAWWAFHEEQRILTTEGPQMLGDLKVGTNIVACPFTQTLDALKTQGYKWSVSDSLPRDSDPSSLMVGRPPSLAKSNPMEPQAIGPEIHQVLANERLKYKAGNAETSWLQHLMATKKKGRQMIPMIRVNNWQIQHSLCLL